jgi:hypothetical protein
MVSLFYVVAFHIWEHPNVPRILALRIPRNLPFTRSLITALARILLGNSKWVYIEIVFVAFGIP